MEADLNDVQNSTRSRRYWPALNLGALPELVLRCWAVLMALASTMAVSLVAVLSVGSYLAVSLLAKIRPLRHAYQLLSRAYDRFLDRFVL